VWAFDSAHQRSSCTFAMVCGCQTDYTASGKAAVTRLAWDPSAIWADATDSHRIDPDRCRPFSSRVRRSTMWVTISSSGPARDEVSVHRLGDEGLESAAHHAGEGRRGAWAEWNGEEWCEVARVSSGKWMRSYLCRVGHCGLDRRGESTLDVPLRPCFFLLGFRGQRRRDKCPVPS